MAYEAVLLPTCAEEREAIVAYMCEALCNPQAASAFLDEFDKKVEAVTTVPESFPEAHDEVLVALGYRFFTVKKYICLYKVVGDKVLLSHLFHQRQSYARLVVR